MAITKILHQKASPGRELGLHTKQLIAYIMNPDKTEECILTGGINCLPDTAYKQMVETKKMYRKLGGRQSYHVIISLVPGEGTLEQLYEMTEKFADEFLGGEYEAVFAIHTDHEHLHSHLVFNSVNMITGKKFQYKNGDWKYKLQPITNKLCEEYGFEVMPAEYSPDPKNVSRDEWERQNSITEMVEADARFCKMVASSRDHYIYLLKELGYEVKDEEHISVKAEGMKRFKRLGTIAPELDYKDTQINNIKADSCYGDIETPEYKTLDPRPIKRAKLTGIQKKYYRRLFKLRLIEKRRFTYRSAKFYEDLKTFNKLQEKYLLLIDENIESINDLRDLHERLDNDIDNISIKQKELYRDRTRFVRDLDKGIFNYHCKLEVMDEDLYRRELDKYKIQKKEIKKKQKLVLELIDEYFDHDKYKELDAINISGYETELDECNNDEKIPQIPVEHVKENLDNIDESNDQSAERKEEHVENGYDEAEMIAVFALCDIQSYKITLGEYFNLTLDERASLWDITTVDKELGFEAFRKLVTAAGVNWSIPDMYEEFQKHFNKCIELKEDPIEKRYILECLKYKMDEADKKLVINRHPYIR